MSKRLQVDRRDGARVLSTEVLPFELPLIFSNQLFHKLEADTSLPRPELARRLLEVASESSRKATIPYTYRILRGDGKTRTLSIMHPSCQREFIRFYRDYDGYILNLCAKSMFSLRRPHQIGSSFFERDYLGPDSLVVGDVGDPAPSGKSEQREDASSYFYYTPFNQIWKFFESPDFIRLEQDFRFLKRLDISSCFPSLYTHSISWAIRGKAFTKRNMSATGFDSILDELMRRANWGETNGILVGPEVCRIFAEIVLQAIDLEFERALRDSALLPRKLAVRRYIDDYFIFAASEQDFPQAEALLVKVLEEYRLALNASKSEKYSSPLISGLSMAREAIRQLLSREVSGRLAATFEAGAPGDGDQVPQRTDVAQVFGPPRSVIRDLKTIIKSYSATYATVTPYALGIIVRALRQCQGRLSRDDSFAPDRARAVGALSDILEVAFFLYRMDVRVPTTYSVARTIVLVRNLAARTGGIEAQLALEIQNLGASVVRQLRDAGVSGPEMSCLLTTLLGSGTKGTMSRSELEKCFGVSGDEIERADYFSLMSALHCGGGRREFKQTHLRIGKEIARRFSEYEDSHHLSAELTLMFFDTLACPYLEKQVKESVVQAMSQSVLRRAASALEVAALLDFADRHLHFIDWRREIGLPQMLSRTQLRPAYG